MTTFFYLLVFLATVLFVTAMRLKPILWMGLLTLSLIAISFVMPNHLILFMLWALFLFSILITLSSKIRQRLLTQPIFKKLSKTLAPMSLTERQAIDAGGVWWERELFSGKPDFRFFKNIPCPQLTSEENAFMEGPVETLCSLLDDWKISENQDLPPEIWKFLKEHHFFGLLIDKEWGGLGFSAIAHSTIVMKIATRSLTGAVTAMVPNSLGPGELIQRYGTEDQKKHYLPRLAKGIEIPCFGLTSPEAGSDATAIIDKGFVCQENFEGTQQLCIRLNWNKRYITLAPIATLIGLAFKLHDPDHLLGTQTELGITLALVPANHPGVETGHRHKPMHMAFMNGPTRGKDVIIPIDWIIGGAARIGAGWEMMMECLSDGRGISLPALATGNAKMAASVTGAYAYLREQFHLPIGKFEGVQEALARIGGMAYLCEAVRRFTATAIDSGIRPSLASAISKYHLTELGRIVGNDAFDIHGGRAIQRGPRNYLSSLYDAIPVSITVEGANILTRSLIIFGQGAVRCHPYLQKEMEAIEKKSLPEFDGLLFKHKGFFLSNLSQAILMNLGLHRFLPVPFPKKYRFHAQQIWRMSNALALLSDVSFMMFGSALKRKETLSARLGDVLSYLYMASALIKYDECQPIPPEEKENPCFQWAMAYCFYKIQTAFDQSLDNFKNPFLRYLLKILLFPLGKIYKSPPDKLNKDISVLLMQESGLREQMLENCYVKEIESDPIGRVELAFKACLQSEPLRNRIKAAIKAGKIAKKDDWKLQLTEAVQANLLTQPEANLILDAEKKRLDGLEVDEFSNGETS